jgi:hypothetical protein
MAPKTRPGDPLAEPHEVSDHSSGDTPSTPLDAIALVQQQMALANACLDEHARDVAAQRHRDSQRNTQAPTHVHIALSRASKV